MVLVRGAGITDAQVVRVLVRSSPIGDGREGPTVRGPLELALEAGDAQLGTGHLDGRVDPRVASDGIGDERGVDRVVGGLDDGGEHREQIAVVGQRRLRRGVAFLVDHPTGTSEQHTGESALRAAVVAGPPHQRLVLRAGQRDVEQSEPLAGGLGLCEGLASRRTRLVGPGAATGEVIGASTGRRVPVDDLVV